MMRTHAAIEEWGKGGIKMDTFARMVAHDILENR